MNNACREFGRIAPTWEAAGGLVEEWAPELSGSADSRYLISTAKRLLQAVILHFRLTQLADRCTLTEVRKVLQAAEADVRPFLQELRASTDGRVAAEAATLADHLDDPWHGGIRQALLCIAEWRFAVDRE